MRARGVEVADLSRDLGAYIVAIEEQRLIAKLVAHATILKLSEDHLLFITERGAAPATQA